MVFTFWLSRVPPELFEAFWDQVARCLRPGGRAFFIDSRGPESTAFDHKHLRTGDISVKRTLNNGREFRIYKLFYAPDELAQQLAELGWRSRIRKTGHFFMFGEVQRAAQAQ